MILRLFEPRHELQQFISRIMINRFKLDTAIPNPTIPFPPQPEHRLYFYPYNKIICRNYANNSVTSMPNSILVGPQLSRVDLTMGNDMLVIMIAFQPGGMHRLLQIPMNEVVDTPIETSLILGSEIHEMTEQLNEAQDLNEMIKLVEFFLLRKMKSLKSMLPVDKVLIDILRQKDILNVDQLAKHACVSVRQLERQFNQRMGMSPKLFSRLVRFSKAWMMRERNEDISWTKIAYGCDYADQMHMIRDFKEFAGVTPTLLQAALERTNLRLQASSVN